MIVSSLAALALASLPLPHLPHLHPAVPVADNRIQFRLENTGIGLRSVGIDGQTYTVLPHHTLTVKAPAGTAVYARGNTLSLRRGDLLLTVSPALKGSIVAMR